MAKSTSKTNTITLEGAFSSIQGLNFDVKKIKNGRELIKDNLFNIQVQEIQSGSKAEILARMFRTTNINETPYVVQFVVDMNTRKVEKSSQSFLVAACLFLSVTLHLEEGRKLVVSADYHEIRARN